MDRDVTCRSLLYHYTSPAGLNGIVTSGSIRATYADFLNDAREIWYGPELCTACRLRPADRDRSRRFHRDTLGLAVCREFADRDDPGLVFFLGGGYLEVSGVGDGTVARNLALWIQVRDLAAEHQRLQAAGVEILRAPEREPWGLLEMWIADPMGYASFWLRFQRNTHCDAIAGEAHRKARALRSHTSAVDHSGPGPANGPRAGFRA